MFLWLFRPGLFCSSLHNFLKKYFQKIITNNVDMVTSGSALRFKLPLAATAGDRRSADDWHVDSGTSNDARYTQATVLKQEVSESTQLVYGASITTLAEMGRAAYMQYVLDVPS
jgi:hypothetical protein